MTRVAVIGGGIAGVSAAAALAEAGHQVTVFEAETALGYHASGRSAAMFEENYGNDVVRVLNRASRPALEARGVLSDRGLLMVALPGEVAEFDADASDMGMERLPVEEARLMVPILSPSARRSTPRSKVVPSKPTLAPRVYSKPIAWAI